MKALRNLFLTFVMVFALAYLTLIAAQAGAVVGKKAPDFSAVDYKGQTHSLAEQKGKVVVLEWLNPDCPFVQRHYREGTMKTLAERYKDRGVAWFAVNSTNYHDADISRQWAEKYDLSYPVLVDKDGKVGKLYGAKTTPHMFVIDREGRLVYSGAVDDDPGGNKEKRELYLEAAIQAALQNQEPAKSET
ncbi:MAG TPA: redoxin domain-containing protein [archaeon]|nr:redoxin domain-containing protein [archaeon]